MARDPSEERYGPVISLGGASQETLESKHNMWDKIIQNLQKYFSSFVKIFQAGVRICVMCEFQL